ncbi:MAG: lipopolysaccharide biosynthesis protein [Bacteroidales bacterium]|nr:lipopolysaccharide biosynthesis protein [Bacteroidales bacterium]
MSDNLNSKIVNATKWSALTEILSKLITPITAMVMARLLTPEAYGVVATFSIIIALADIFADAGFQKYLIQREFSSPEEKDKHTNVAFWSNLVMSFFLWIVIAIFCQPLATLVGSPGLGLVLVVSCVGIPLTGFCSIQMALMKRDFDFKTLFWRRLVSILVPIFVTIPLAFWLRSYWALVLGSLAMNLANTVFLTFKSNWKPRKFYSFAILKEMFSFCSWSLVDSLLVWATVYADIFFISRYLDAYSLGLYRTSISMVGHIVTLITAIVLPVVMPALSRLQNDIPEMRRMLLKFQKITGIILIPLGVGIFVFQDLITNIMLGEQWGEAAPILGLWGLMEAITIVFARFCSPVYPAVGKPRVSVVVQTLHVVVLIPAVIISGKYGFETLYITRSLIRLEGVLVNLVAVYILIKQSPWKMIVNIIPQISAALLMAIVGYILLMISNNVILSFVWIAICIMIYFGTLHMFPKERTMLLDLKNKALSSLIKKKK